MPEEQVCLADYRVNTKKKKKMPKYPNFACKLCNKKKSNHANIV